MKKISVLLLSVIMLCALSACSSNNTSVTEGISVREESSAEETSAAVQSDMETTEAADAAADADAASGDSRILVAYFSKTGNTESIANIVAETTGGELFRVETVTPYPEDYDETVDIARVEQDSDVRPELSTDVDDMSQYDTIYLGFPNWWGTMPMAMFTFLEEYDFAGKTIIPFCTHGGSALGSSESDIANLAPDANLAEGFAVSGSAVSGAQADVEEWISELQSPAETAEITITVGETVIQAELNDSEAAQEFASRLPLNVSMTRMGEHEYYGSLDEPLTHTEELQTGYEVGDIAFWTPGNLLAVYFDEPDEAPEGLMTLGAVTSDMSVFSDMDNSVEMYIERIE